MSSSEVQWFERHMEDEARHAAESYISDLRRARNDRLTDAVRRFRRGDFEPGAGFGVRQIRQWRRGITADQARRAGEIVRIRVRAYLFDMAFTRDVNIAGSLGRRSDAARYRLRYGQFAQSPRSKARR